MKRFAAVICACFLTAIVGGCAASPSSPAKTVTVTVTQSQPPASQGGGLGQGSTSPAPSATSAPAPSLAASEVGVCVTPLVTCNGELKSEPAEIIVSGDSSAFITGLTWTGWGHSGATGSGTLKLDNCNPNCAQGTLTGYPVTVVLSRLTSYGGGAAYATMMVVAPGSPFGTRTYHHLAP